MKKGDALWRQGDLFTSRLAAEGVDTTKLEAQVYAAIQQAGPEGATWDEVCERSGLDKGSVSPRFKPLRTKGFIKAKTTPDGITITRRSRMGKGQIVWIAAK